jgi:hypothetical protein
MELPFVANPITAAACVQEAWLRFRMEAAPAVDDIDGASGASLEPWVAHGLEQVSKHLEAQERILGYAHVLSQQMMTQSLQDAGAGR